MCLGHNFPCGFPCCQYSGASLSSSFFQDDETQHVQDVDYHHVPTPHSLPSSSGVTVPSLPTRAQPEPSTLGDPAYAQLPPDDVLGYWICHFELTLPTTSAEDSKSATFPPSGVVTNDIDPVAHLGCSDTRPTVHADASTSTSKSQAVSQSLPSSSTNQAERKQPKSGGAVPRQRRAVCARRRSNPKRYDRPGKKPAAEYEPDPLNVQASCRSKEGNEEQGTGSFPAVSLLDAEPTWQGRREGGPRARKARLWG